MSDMTNESRVLEVVRRVVEPSRRDSVRPESFLFDEKLLDSFAIINLVAALEEEFNISIPTEELTTANFAAVRDVIGLVDRLGRAQR